MTTCSPERLDLLSKLISRKMLKDNGLLMLNAILMGIVVFIGAYAPRFRHHPLIRYLFLGATTLFLPIATSVVETATNLSAGGVKIDSQLMVSECLAQYHIAIVLIWTGLVVTIATNTSTAVAADPRENKSIFFPVDLFVKAIWITYIIVSTSSDKLFRRVIRQVDLIFIPLYVLTFSKLGLRCSAFFIARRSDALGRNPKLISQHMAQLGTCYSNLQHLDQQMHVPALVVKGENTAILEKRPHGYRFKTIVSRRLVTLDRLWKLDHLAMEHKDLCFSFSLFKLLRCKFARYTVLKPILRKVQLFLHDEYLQRNDPERLFRVVADELSFIHDYYNSFLPISYSHPLFPFMNIIISFLSICYCSYLFVLVSRQPGPLGKYGCQIYCVLRCGKGSEDPMRRPFGHTYFDVVPAFLVIAVLMISEMRNIIVYICSNWTKVALIPGYTKWIVGFVFKCCSSRSTNNWEGTLSQCSLPVGSQNKCSMYVPIVHLFQLPNRKKIVITKEVKASIFNALKGQISKQDGVLKQIRPPSSLSIPINGDGKDTADIVLAWHIATSIFGARHQGSDAQISPAQISATQLSRYCTYLVYYHPELLPGEDNEWCKTLFEAVKKDAERILSVQPRCRPGEEEYNMLVDQLSGDTLHEVLNDGVEIAKKLGEPTKGWEVLEDFWSNMILYLAPSENLDAHAAAISRGGELITLLWALLAHHGIVGRLDEADATTGDLV